MGLPSISLCTGSGALDLSVELACPGVFEPLLLVEGEAFACAVLVKQMEEGALPRTVVWGDVRTVVSPECGDFLRTALGGRNLGLLYGGIPCQPHSVAGKRKGKDDERDLWPATAAIIEEYRPWLVFIENVPGMFGDVCERVGPHLRRLGYRVPRPLLLEAAEVGAPHRRERLFILGVREGLAHVAAYSAGDAARLLQRRRRISPELADPRRQRDERRGESGDVGGAEAEEPRQARQRERDGDAAGDGESAMGESDGTESECPSGIRGGRAAEGGGRKDRQPARPSGGVGESPDDRHERGGLPRRRRAGPANAVGRIHASDDSGGLGDADEPGREGRGLPRSGRADGLPARQGGGAVERLPLFPPGPGLGLPGVVDSLVELFPSDPDAAWRRFEAERANTLHWIEVLRRWPWLAPAISQEEIESSFRFLVDGLESVLACRIDALRAVGNGVCPLQAAVALRILLRRAGLEWLVYQGEQRP